MELPITAQGLITACTSPRVCRVESFLTDTECAVLIAAAYPRLQPAYAGLQAGEGRTSQGCELPCELPAAASVLRKVRGLVRLPFERMEEVYVSRYSRGQRYDTHHDAPDESDPDAERFLASGGGQRVATVLVYLNTVASGGQTTFPLAGSRWLQGGVRLITSCGPLCACPAPHLPGGAPPSAQEWHLSSSRPLWTDGVMTWPCMAPCLLTIPSGSHRCGYGNGAPQTLCCTACARRSTAAPISTTRYSIDEEGAAAEPQTAESTEAQTRRAYGHIDHVETETHR